LSPLFTSPKLAATILPAQPQLLCKLNKSQTAPNPASVQTTFPAPPAIREDRLRIRKSRRRLQSASDPLIAGTNVFRHCFFKYTTLNGAGTLPLPPDSRITAMDGLLQIELTSHERDVLLRGLRYVRSAIMLETREPCADDTRVRSGLLDEIQNLSQRLENTDPLPVNY
jgi:hypothetical protein